MKRAAIQFLNDWLVDANRKPLVIRGARQVGKTWLVRHLAQSHKLRLIEINFESRPQFISLFNTNDPKRILLNLSSLYDEVIDPKSTLLLLDEIQAAPELLAKLRWFAEDMPELPVISAGSLLEFVLDNHTFSMPVGRIQYMHLEPLSFEEFLKGHKKDQLIDYLTTYNWDFGEIPQVIHEQLLAYLKEYIVIGGMPAAVSSWIEHRSLTKVNQIHHDLIATYLDDGAKYSGRLSTQRLAEVMMAVPKYLGEKFIYTRVNPLAQIASIKQALDLLCKSRVCHRVFGCAANGVPLGAELQEKYLKVIFLDVGLCSAALGLTLDSFANVEELTLINKGGIAEQLVGQILRTLAPFYIEPALYYWHRDVKGSSAEIDYIIQHGNNVIPIEVKAGSTGKLRSLHYFMNLKSFPLAVRINSDLPSRIQVDFKDHHGTPVIYQLLSLPFYLLGQLHRLLKDAIKGINK